MSGFDNAASAGGKCYRPFLDRASAPSPFRVDEGYSEDPRSQADSDAEQDADMLSMETLDTSAAREASARQWLLSQPLATRTALARDLMHSLPTSSIADLVREANHRLHFDPVACLPHEIITHIFEYLEPKSLCSTALTSRAWKLRAYDPRLWKRLFTAEGWVCDHEKLEALESNARGRKRTASNFVVGGDSGVALGDTDSTKRYRTFPPVSNTRTSLHPGEDGSLDLPEMYLDIGVRQPPPPLSLHGSHQGDAEMLDVPNDTVPAIPNHRISQSASHTKLFTLDPLSEQIMLNWHYVYTQRRRLERNWHMGRFTNFRLPHPDHQEDTHTQCVYTVQFSENHLVSGSRDKTVRVWDLNTQRLRLPPLEGHTGSVLCLQFDERPEQDIIVSGGSDADVIIWRFSDGSMLKRMEHAHTESVLNLRFDERYLVTCSKDKSIRVWNQHRLLPDHPDYPDISKARNARYPDYIVNIHDILSNPAPSVVEPLEPFTLLMTFDGHSAAVNALQIHNYEVVSASGDRKIMLWNIKKGELTRVFAGHTKGIACIQYDGRRIVSGSSDNSVRIFDAHTSAEVATLDGHRNLVRTVQAEFGDLGDSTDYLEAEARRSDRRFAEQHTLTNEPRLASEEPLIDIAGSSNEDNYGRTPFVTGAKLPPGGGGTKWSKIVSGSYDETLIVWRRDRNGRWYIAKELRQEDALRSASRSAWRSSTARRLLRLSHDALPAAPPQVSPDHVLGTGAGGVQVSHDRNSGMPAWRQQQFLQRSGPTRQSQISNATLRLPAEQSLAPPPPAPMPNQQPAAYGMVGLPPQMPLNSHGPISAPQAPMVPPPLVPHQQIQQGQGLHQPLVPQQIPPPHHNHHPPHPPGLGFAHQQIRQGPLAPRRPHHYHHHHDQAAAAAAAAATAGGAPSLNNRIFKLQFDARRIVCCSQEPVIVGWDFAAGEKAVENVSWLFGVPR